MIYGCLIGVDVRCLLLLKNYSFWELMILMQASYALLWAYLIMDANLGAL